MKKYLVLAVAVMVVVGLCGISEAKRESGSTDAASVVLYGKNSTGGIAPISSQATSSVTTTSASAASATAELAASSTYKYRILLGTASSSDQNYTLTVEIADTVVWTNHGLADTTAYAPFGAKGRVVTNQKVEVICTPAATGQCSANLLYEIVYD